MNLHQRNEENMSKRKKKTESGKRHVPQKNKRSFEEHCFLLDQSREILIQTLRERKRLLEKLIRDIEAISCENPKGYLRTSRRNNGFQYYWREDSSEKWVYLPKKELVRAREIAEDEYRTKVLQASKKELIEIRRLLGDSAPLILGIGNLYEAVKPGRRALFQSWIASEESVKEDFLSFEYDPLETYVENKQYETANGEVVRSKAEWMIAATLDRFRVPYQYEAPLILRDNEFLRPDFRCINLRTRRIYYWEHLGMMGDSEYAASAIAKMEKYEAAGYFVGKNLIVTEECSDCPLTPDKIETRIRQWLL